MWMLSWILSLDHICMTFVQSDFLDTNPLYPGALNRFLLVNPSRDSSKFIVIIQTEPGFQTNTSVCHRGL